MKQTKIIINIHGGLVQSIISDNDIDVCILDFDTDGESSPIIKTHDNKDVQCNIYSEKVGVDKEYTNHYFKELEKIED